MKHKHTIYRSGLRRFQAMLLLFIGILVLSTGACKQFVAVEPPKSQLLGELVFEEPGTAKAALAGIYGQLRDGLNGILNGQTMGMTFYLGNYADEMINHNTLNQTYGPNFYNNRLFADSDDIYNLWINAYNQIYNANAILEGVERSSKLTIANKNQFKGEALFIRALLHFYLSNLFGDIPYVTGTDYLKNRNLYRDPVKMVNQLILSDLLQAEALLSENYPSAERVRPNKFVVRAFLARVYLYQEDWENAEKMASSVIGHTALYMWVDELSKVFLKESAGTIWAFIPKTAGGNTTEAANFIIFTTPAGSTLSKGLYDAFEKNDQRKIQWIGVYTQGLQTWYFPYKYKVRASSTITTNTEYSVILRLEEQYLIRSEARAQMENLEGARQDLNKIRNRAGLGDTDAMLKSTLLSAILKERRVELFAEFGHRWFDLKRTGKAGEFLAPIKPNWNAEDILLPVPEKELLVNPNLRPQNYGY